MLIDNELNILNILIIKPNKRAFIFENTEADFFVDRVNKEIYKTARKLFESGEDIDNVVIYEKNKMPEVNQRLVEILTETITYENFVKKYCSILLENYLNSLIQTAKTKEDFEKIQEIKQKYDLKETNIQHVSAHIEDFEERYHEKMDTLIQTGYADIDNAIGSFMGGDYIALGGSTGTGKTTLALNLARQFCMQEKNVLYCSLEMPLEQLQNRFVCLNNGLNAMKYRSCGFDKDEYARYKEGLKELKHWNLFILTDYNLTIEKLKIYAQQQKQKGLDFIIIDYLGLMSGYGNNSLYEKSTKISRKIKILATELNIPILALVQLNRDLKNRQDKRPILSDIRESGAIEQDADFVLFAHRPSSYDTYLNKNDFELIVAKNRHGENNKICLLDFDLKTQLIKER